MSSLPGGKEKVNLQKHKYAVIKSIMNASKAAKSYKPEEYLIENEPYYEPVADEIEIYQAAYKNKLQI